MPLHIDRVDTEIEILRKESTDASAPESGVTQGAGGETDPLDTVRGRIALRERLRPIVMEILDDELNRIKRKVGSP
jgi:hypothetical protein